MFEAFFLRLNKFVPVFFGLDKTDFNLEKLTFKKKWLRKRVAILYNS